MAPKIYTSSYPAVPTYNRSIFTHLFAPHKDPNNVGDYPGTLPAYVDAPTGTVLTRAQLKSLALKLGYGLRNHPSFKAKRGDTIMVYSQNSLTWPVVLFGSGEQSNDLQAPSEAHCTYQLLPVYDALWQTTRTMPASLLSNTQTAVQASSSLVRKVLQPSVKHSRASE